MSGRGSSPRRLRVAIVGPSMDIIGGQSVVLDRLLKRLRQVSELDVSFIPVNPRLPGPLGALQRIKYVRTVVTSIAYFFSLVRRVPAVDVVHAFSASYWSFLLAPVPAMATGRLFGKHVVLNYHSGEADDHLANWKSAIPLIKLAHHIVVPSGYLVDVFKKHGLRATSVFNFVDVEGLEYRQRAIPLRPRFLSNRNLEPLYNVECTIEAFARIQQEMPDAELVVAGDGSERVRLEQLVAERKLTGVRFVGRIPHSEMSALYRDADVYLNSPNIDNMPSSIIEAFAAGIPVVTTDAGGIPYIVRHEDNGMMVKSGDAAALAAQALRLLRDGSLADRIASRARQECLDAYVWGAVRERWMAVYTQQPVGSAATLALSA